MPNSLDETVQQIYDRAARGQQIYQDRLEKARLECLYFVSKTIEFLDNYKTHGIGIDDNSLANLESQLVEAQASSDADENEINAIQSELHKTKKARATFFERYFLAKSNYLRVFNLSRNIYANMTGAAARTNRMFATPGANSKEGLPATYVEQKEETIRKFDLMIAYLDSISPQMTHNADEMLRHAGFHQYAMISDLKRTALEAEGVTARRLAEAGRQAYSDMLSDKSIENALARYAPIEARASDIEAHADDY